MKKLIILLCATLPWLSIAQEVDVAFYQTWYLYNFLSDDLSGSFNIQETHPRIAPEVTFTETFEFSGFGGCNTFEGTFEIGGTDEFPHFITTSFSAEEVVCEDLENNQIDSGFLDLLENGEFAIVFDQADEGQSLFFFTALGGESSYGIAPLAVQDVEKEVPLFYPNPVSDRLFFNLKPSFVGSIKMYSTTGEQVFIANEKLDSMDVSTFEQGVYFLHLTADKEDQIIQIIIR